MSFPAEIVDRIFQYLPPVYYPNLLVYANVNKAWYSGAKKVFYKNLNITSNTRVAQLLSCLENYNIKFLVVNINISSRFGSNFPPISDEENSFRLFRACINTKKIEIQGVDVYDILRSIRRANFWRLEEIRIHWIDQNISPNRRSRFYAANFAHRNSIKYITLPPLAVDEGIQWDNGRLLTKEEFYRLFPKLTFRVNIFY